MSRSPVPATAPRARPTGAVVGAFVVALVVAVVAAGLAACGGGGTAYGGPLVGTCRGFASHGALLADTRLLGRAVATWRHEGGAMAQPVPVAPPVGRVCVVDAHRQPGLSLVTLADATHLASYRESDGGVATVSSDALPSGRPYGLPVVSVGNGQWLLARDVTSAQVWVGGSQVAPETMTVPAGRGVVDVEVPVNAFALRHPGVLPHLLVLCHAAGHLYAATGGVPYAATSDEVLAVSLGADDAATTAGWEQVLGLPSGVALVAQAVGFTRQGRQTPQQVDRQLTVVGVTTAAVGTVLVVREEPDDGSHLAAETVTVVQRSRTGADAQPVGTVTSPTGSWVGSVWLDPVAAGDPDPRELLVMGEPGTLGGTVGGTDGAAVDLEAFTGSEALFARGPLRVVTRGDLRALGEGPDRPDVKVTARVGDLDVLPLTPAP